jgi:hypothetical protein
MDGYIWNRQTEIENQAQDWATDLSAERPWFADLFSNVLQYLQQRSNN